MPKPLPRDAPELFDGRWVERGAASARLHIEELRERLDLQRHEEATADADRPPRRRVPAAG